MQYITQLIFSLLYMSCVVFSVWSDILKVPCGNSGSLISKACFCSFREALDGPFGLRENFLKSGRQAKQPDSACCVINLGIQSFKGEILNN